MRFLLLGASGGIGRFVRDHARAAGHDLVLYARDPASLVPLASTETAVKGEITDETALRDALSGVDAVVSVVGPTSNSRDEVDLFAAFGGALVAALFAAGVSRVVAISGGACSLPGEQKPLRARLASGVVRMFVGNVVLAKQRELDAIVASDLDWTAPRPPRVVVGPASGSYRAGETEQGLRITQGDIAAFMVDQLTDDKWVRKAPYVSN